MSFNYGLEKKNFDRQWAIVHKQYEDAGMSIEVIQAMYEYDWSVFCAFLPEPHTGNRCPVL